MWINATHTFIGLKESKKFTKKEVQELSGVSTNVVSKIINQLVDLKVIVPDSTMVKKGYRYQKIYEVFVGVKEFL